MANRLIQTDSHQYTIHTKGSECGREDLRSSAENLQAKHIVLHIITAHSRFDHKNQYTLITIDVE